jgi:hypothetical protein
MGHQEAVLLMEALAILVVDLVVLEETQVLVAEVVALL